MLPQFHHPVGQASVGPFVGLEFGFERLQRPTQGVNWFASERIRFSLRSSKTSSRIWTAVTARPSSRSKR
jgi:hypothetical protein